MSFLRPLSSSSSVSVFCWGSTQIFYLVLVVCVLASVLLMPLRKVWLSLKNSFSVSGIGDHSQPLMIAPSPRLRSSYIRHLEGTRHSNPLSSTWWRVFYSPALLDCTLMPINKPPSSYQSCGCTSFLMQIYSSTKLNFLHLMFC
jgi:hypothetical protein